MDAEVKKLIDEFIAMDEVESIVLGGSRSGENHDTASDYDLYIYTDQTIPEERRSGLYERYCSRYETGNKYFEYEDNIVMKNGIYADIIYRKFPDIERYLVRVVDEGRNFNGYTTCFWHNVIKSEIIYDREGRYEALKNKYDIPYPEKLRRRIISRNMKLLHGCLPSYDKQLSKAFGRNDIVSINHRTAAFIESYFDIIFALNRMTHPGEKKLVDICKRECKLLPEKFEENLTKLFENMYSDSAAAEEAVSDIVKNLNGLLHENGIDYLEEYNEG